MEARKKRIKAGFACQHKDSSRGKTGGYLVWLR
jgi:hypothetical protein